MFSTVQVCPELRDFLACGIFSAKTWKVPGKAGHYRVVMKMKRENARKVLSMVLGKELGPSGHRTSQFIQPFHSVISPPPPHPIILLTLPTLRMRKLRPERIGSISGVRKGGHRTAQRERLSTMDIRTQPCAMKSQQMFLPKVCRP